MGENGFTGQTKSVEMGKVSYSRVDQCDLADNQTLNGYGAVAGESSLSAAGVKSPKNDKKTTTPISALTIILCVLVGDMARGIVFPTLWLRIKSLGGSKLDQGIAVSAFSAGRIMSSPLFGSLSEVHGYRSVLAACNIIIILGCLLYTVAHSIPMVLLAQWIVGFGAGSLGVTRAFVAEHTAKKERTEFMAYLTAVQYAGFTVTPVIGAALSAFAYNSTYYSEITFINQYSIPAVFQMCCAGVCVLLLAVAFVETPRDQQQQQQQQRIEEQQRLVQNKAGDSIEQGATSSIRAAATSTGLTTTTVAVAALETADVSSTFLGFSLSTADWLAIGGCVLNATTKGTIGVYETLGVEYSTAHYDWTAMEMGGTVTACGITGVVFLLLFSLLLRCFSDTYLVLYGIIIMAVSSFLLTPIIDTPNWMFMASLISMYAVGYPIGHTALIGIFSKIMKSGPQGRLLGIFGSAGSFARVVFPILAGLLTDQYNDGAIFMLMSAILVISAVFYACYLPTIEAVIKSTS